MNKLKEINLLGKPVKDQLLAVEKMPENINSSNPTEILTNEELLVKYIPPKALEKKIKIKFKFKNDVWSIQLEKE